jgi:DNA-binding CsgD family transcriptional regulator
VELAWLRGDAAGAARLLAAVPPVPGVWGADVGAWAARWRARTGSGDAANLLAEAERHPDPLVRTAPALEVRAATARTDADPADAWARTAAVWLDAERPWEAAWASLAEAEARFAARDSGAGKTALEAALATAITMGAEPLRTQVEALARRARIRVGTPGRQRAQPDEPTERELQVLALLAEGLTNPQIAERLFLSPKTVGIHVSRLLDKLDAHTRGEAVAVARRRGLFA